MGKIQTTLTVGVVTLSLLALAYALSLRDPYVVSAPTPIHPTTTVTPCPKVAPVQCCDTVREKWALGMERLANTDHVTLKRLERRYGWDPLELVTPAIVYGRMFRIPPEVLVAMAWWESRWAPKAVGDEGVSCGITQVRTDYEDRPPCSDLMNPTFAIEWTARKLDTLRDDDGNLQISRYNGSGVGALEYEIRVWRTAHMLMGYTGG